MFILSNRRAAVVGLAAAFVVFSTMLFFRNRRAFLVLVPTVLVLMTAYTAAFWNSTSGAAFGARAVKTVFASSDISDRDSSSDLYRTIENFDLVNTIHSSPLTGVGFGKRFYQPAPLPDISFFVFYQFIPHNSILWIWLKVGYLGFVAFLFLVAAAIRAGTRASLTLPSGDLLVVTVCALSFIVMFITFAYVDIAFDTKSCLFLAVCMATCANIVRLTRAAAPIEATRVPSRV